MCLCLPRSRSPLFCLKWEYRSTVSFCIHSINHNCRHEMLKSFRKSGESSSCWPFVWNWELEWKAKNVRINWYVNNKVWFNIFELCMKTIKTWVNRGIHFKVERYIYWITFKILFTKKLREAKYKNRQKTQKKFIILKITQHWLGCYV